MGAIVTCPLEVVKTRLQSSATLCRRPVATVRMPTSTGGGIAGHLYFTPEMNWNLYYHHQQCPINPRLAVFHTAESTLPWTTSVAHPKGTLSCFRYLKKKDSLNLTSLFFIYKSISKLSSDS